MSQEDKGRLIDRLLRTFDARNMLVEFFCRNAATRHGVPWGDSKTSVPVESIERTTNVERTQVGEQSSWKKYVAAALIGGSGIGIPAGFLINYFTDDSSEKVEQPEDKTGSLLQYLEDEGMHVPDGE